MFLYSPNIPPYMINSHMFYFCHINNTMMTFNYFLFSFSLPSKTSMIKSMTNLEHDN